MRIINARSRGGGQFADEPEPVKIACPVDASGTPENYELAYTSTHNEWPNEYSPLTFTRSTTAPAWYTTGGDMQCTGDEWILRLESILGTAVEWRAGNYNGFPPDDPSEWTKTFSDGEGEITMTGWGQV